MADKYQNKYRISSIRLQNWDYRWAAAYFITICTHNRKFYFGNVENGKMHLSPIGVIADVLWYEIKHHAHNIELDAFVVMPNHIHCILILNGENTDGNGCGAEKDGNGRANENNCRGDEKNNGIIGGNSGISEHAEDAEHIANEGHSPDSEHIVQSGHALTQHALTPRFQHIGKNSISSIIGSYKSAITKHAHRLGYEFEWQTLFYEHIIRDHQAFNTIQTYILNNPSKWGADKFH